MILGRLLTAGKSLVGSQSSASRYQMNRSKLLPRFEPRSKPRRSPVRAEAINGTQESPRQSAAPATASPGAKTTEPRRAFHKNPIRPFSDALSTLFSRFSRPATAKPKSAIPQFRRTPVQSELSLESVKVIRNDLSDADIEVVASGVDVSSHSRNPIKRKRPAEELETVAAWAGGQNLNR